MFTVYDIDNNKFTQVEEPDPSLTYTYADYLQWNFEERLELIRGHIFKMSPAPVPFHQRVLVNLLTGIHGFLKNKKCKVYPAPFDVRLPVGNKKEDEQVTTVVQPDICVICDESKIDGRGCIGAPDLVIEILSKSTAKKDKKLKLDVYEQSGVREFWIVDPKMKTVLVYVLNDLGSFEPGIFYEGEQKITSTILPGFETDLSEIFTN